MYSPFIDKSMTKTMTVSRSRTVHLRLTPLTLDETVLKGSADLVILGVTFDAKMTFEKHAPSLCFRRCSSEAWYHEKVLTSIS